MSLHNQLWQIGQASDAKTKQEAQGIAGTITDSQGRVHIMPADFVEIRWPRARRASRYWPEGIGNL